MDDYGISTAITAYAKSLFANARHTGRTESMLRHVADGDTIIFSNEKEAARIEAILADLEIDAKCIILPPERPQDLFSRTKPAGQVIFDHSWLEEFWLHALKNIATELTALQEAASGRGLPHRKQRAAAKAIKAKGEMWK